MSQENWNKPGQPQGGHPQQPKNPTMGGGGGATRPQTPTQGGKTNMQGGKQQQFPKGKPQEDRNKG